MADTKKGAVVVWDNAPAVIKHNDDFTPNIGENPARYLVDPGRVIGVGKHSPGQLRHARPYLVSGNVIFVFPVGVEGFSTPSEATLSLHRYIGANTVAAQSIMREESRVMLTGTFPGGTAQDAMVNCRNILRSLPPTPGLVLYAPGVFDTEQYVVPESWEFTHAEDDRTHSIQYSITLVRVGNGKGVSDPHGTPARPNPTTQKRSASIPSRYYTIRSGVSTFQQIAKAVYGTTAQWTKLVPLNSALVQHAFNLAAFQLPTYRWPVGVKIRY